ncbi:MAG TPA: AAA family ATPase [Candidatus Nanoarchaeia archaeon]|nr:AAA family ATPase [Candidatus Nanoarchaeia archaeon]
MATQLVIGIVGMPGSGKSTVSDHLVKKYKAERIHLGDFIWEWLGRQGIKPNEQTGTMAALYMWVEYGDIPLSQWAFNQTKKSKAKIVILDSLRTVEEARFFQLKFGNNFHAIAVLASPAARLARTQKRARFGALSKLEFRMRDREELRLGVGDLIASANHYIDANQSVQKVQKQVDVLMKHLR